MRIPEHKIDEIRQTADISDIVGDYVELKRRGVSYWGLCPFHKEKTPSFSVNPQMGIYKCFGCGKGGNAFSFLMDVEKIGFVEAVRTLAERYNISLPEKAGKSEKDAGDNDKILQSLRFAGNVFYKNLREDKGKSAMSYLKERKLSDEALKLFAVGYSADSFREFKELALKEGFNEETLLDAGLLSKNDKGDTYDRFRNRIMFPLQGTSGQVIGFGGRVMPDSDDKAKYVNSPETRVYHKSKFLYGLYQAKHEIRRDEYAVVVEGYTDVMRLHENGVLNVVASSGTSLTVDQVALIKRYAKKAVLVFDSDAAGILATERAIDIMLNAEIEVRCLVLPEGQDPDSVVQEHGGQYFKDLIRTESLDFVNFKIKHVHGVALASSPEEKLDVVRSLLESISNVKHPIARDGYVAIAASELGVPETQLFVELRQRVGAKKQKRRREPEEKPAAVLKKPGGKVVVVDVLKRDQPLPEEMQLIRIMLSKGQKVADLILRNVSLQEFTAGPSREVVDEMVKMRQKGEYDVNRFLDDSLGGDIREFVAGILVPKQVLSARWAEKLKTSVEEEDKDPILSAVSAMIQLKLDIVKKIVHALRERLKESEQNGVDSKELVAQISSFEAQKLFIQNRENYI